MSTLKAIGIGVIAAIIMTAIALHLGTRYANATGYGTTSIAEIRAGGACKTVNKMSQHNRTDPVLMQLTIQCGIFERLAK